MTNRHLIFVYGTLKRGWGNNAIIHDQKFLSEASTVGNKYQMHALGGFPGIVSGDKNIPGELWEVDDTAFARCDRLEGHPNFYKRELVSVTSKVNGEDVLWSEQAWIYVYQGDVSNRQMIEEWTHNAY